MQHGLSGECKDDRTLNVALKRSQWGRKDQASVQVKTGRQVREEDD